MNISNTFVLGTINIAVWFLLMMWTIGVLSKHILMQEEACALYEIRGTTKICVDYKPSSDIIKYRVAGNIIYRGGEETFSKTYLQCLFSTIFENPSKMADIMNSTGIFNWIIIYTFINFGISLFYKFLEMKGGNVTLTYIVLATLDISGVLLLVGEALIFNHLSDTCIITPLHQTTILFAFNFIILFTCFGVLLLAMSYSCTLFAFRFANNMRIIRLFIIACMLGLCLVPLLASGFVFINGIRVNSIIGLIMAAIFYIILTLFHYVLLVYLYIKQNNDTLFGNYKEDFQPIRETN